MKYFMYEMLIGTFQEGEYFIGVVFWLFFLILAGILMFVALYLIDSTGRVTKNDYGTIVGKCFTPAHTTTTLVMIGKVMSPIVSHSPDTWEVEFKTPDGNDSISVTEEFYLKSETGDRHRVKYSSGRLSEKIYIKEVL